MTFDPNNPNAVVIMYPAGGYGNFLYLLLSQYLDQTVKVSQSQFEFSNTGDSHSVTKHVESFLLGTNPTRSFKYSYKIFDDNVADQIAKGKLFLILGDVGNRGDNVRFLKKYFPNARIVRVYAETFEEKLIVWFNCMTKTIIKNQLYPGSLLTVQGIQKWANKININDEDAVACMATFFSQDFAPYGNYFNRPCDDAINVRLKEFFTVDSVVSMVQKLAQTLDTNLIDLNNLYCVADKFVAKQRSFDLLSQKKINYPLICKALDACGKQLVYS